MAETDGLVLPIGLTEQKFAQQLARIEAQAVRASQRAQQSFVKANAEITRSFSGLSRGATAQLQNVAFQAQDVFAQVAGGQGFTRALSQQLPQLLGGFGALGAVIGVAVAAGIPLASMLMETGEQAQSLDDVLEGLSTSSKDYQAAVKELLTPMSEMYDLFGDNAEQARQMQEALADLARIRLADSIGTAVDAVYAQFDGVKAALAEIRRMEPVLADPIVGGDAANAIAIQVEQIRREFGLTREEAEALSRALDRVDMAETVGEQVTAMNEVIRLAQSALSSEINLSAERRAGLEKLIQMGLEINRNASAIEASADGAQDLATNTGAAADEASRLAGTDMASGIAAAAANALTLAQRLAMAAEQAAAIGSAPAPVDVSEKGFFKPDLNRFGNPYAGEGGAGPSTSSRPKARPIQMDADWGWSTAKGGGGGGGGGAKRDEYAQSIERVQERIDLMKAETAAFTEAAGAHDLYGSAADYAKIKADLLNAAQRQGMAITPELSAKIEEQARAYAQAAQDAEYARQKIEAVQDASKRGEDALGDVFGAILEGSDAAKRAVANLLMEIAKIQIQKGLLALLGAGGGGGITSAIGGLLSFDGGGYTWDGPRSGGLDGKGGRLAMLHPRETVIDHTKGQRVSSAPQVVQVVVTANDYFDARVDQRASAVSQAHVSQANRQMPDRSRQIAKDPRRR